MPFIRRDTLPFTDQLGDMMDPACDRRHPVESEVGQPEVSQEASGRPAAPGKDTAEKSAPLAEPPAEANRLTPEEQMALFEKELKENDWGHQPC